MAHSQDTTPPFLRVKLVDIQITLTPPVPALAHAYRSPIPNGATSFPIGTLPTRVPLIKIFGATPANQSVCVNVHGVWPYFFVDYPEERSLAPDAVHRYTHRLANSLNAALCQSLRQDAFVDQGKPGAGGLNTNTLHVASVVLVKGVPFYGYHVGYAYYLKISLVTPSHIHRAVKLLEGASIMGKKFASYESHLASKLQFMIDFDLYGCGWVDLDGGLFRLPLPEGDAFDPSDLHTSLTVPAANIHAEEPLPGKSTWDALEIDVFPYHVLNRRRLKPRYLHDSLREFLHPETIDADAKHVRSVRELWEEEAARRVSKGLPATAGMMPSADDKLVRVGLSQEDAAWRGGDWDASERWWQMLQFRVQEERREKGYSKMKFETLGKPRARDQAQWDKWIMTTFESVEAGWPQSRMSVRKPGQTQVFRPVPQSSPLKPTQGQAEPEMLAEIIESDGPNPFDVIYTSQRPPSFKEEAAEDVEVDVKQVERIGTQAAWVEESGDVTPKRGGNGYDELQDDILDFVRGGEGGPDDEDADSFEFSSKLTQMHSQRKQNTLLRTPGKTQRWEKTTTNTPVHHASNTPSKLRHFTTPTKAGRENPYYPGSRSSDRQSSPVKTPVAKNLFARAKASPTPQRNLGPRRDSGVPVRNPFIEGGDREAALAAEDVLMSDETIKPQDGGEMGLAQDEVDLVASRATMDGNVDGDSDDPEAGLDRPAAVGVDAEAQAQIIDPLTISTGIKRHRQSWESEEALEPTFTDPTPPASPSDEAKQSHSRDLAATFLAPTYVSGQATKPKKRARFMSQEPVDAARPSDSTGTVVSETISANSEESTHIIPNTWKYQPPPISRKDMIATLDVYDEPFVVYQKPYFSIHTDVPLKAKSFGTEVHHLAYNGVAQLEPFEFEVRAKKRPRRRKGKRKPPDTVRDWVYVPVPPPKAVVELWLEKDKQEREAKIMNTRAKAASQWGGPTQANRYGFSVSQKKKNSNSHRERQAMSTLAIEVFATSRMRLLPDPEQDAIAAVFYCLQDERIDLPDYQGREGYHVGMIAVRDKRLEPGRIALPEVDITYVEDELELMNYIIDKVREWNPDILAGWEVHSSSWGYLSQRLHHQFSMDLADEVSRVKSVTNQGRGFGNYDRTHTSAFKVSGRHVFNIWRILRGELNLLGYSFENVAFHLLRQRFPHYSSSTLTAWFKSKYPAHLDKVLRYFVNKTVMYIEMMDAAEITTKNAEFARVFGVDFASVMSRGSQFKVESFMFRIAKPESFVLISPSREAVGKQNAAEAQPLIFEPQSKFYVDPVLVLDFQSLYPSVMIGYNYCYSTCLGRVERFKGASKLGWIDMVLPPGELELLQNQVSISPNGIIYAKQHLRRSLLAKMLTEILDTRVMVKQGMKTAKGDKSLLQVLNARQLGLKLMANVTYGYTGASFSGRMPCVEIADSIVQTGRETLEKAIKQIEMNAAWKAEVVYGDTDSLFVHLPGRTKDEAFRIGNEIADAVTTVNPRPVKLKFEKVYTKSLLMAKKRYVGFKYESIDEIEPGFDAKGIETVRRDGFPAGQKMVESVIKELFRTQDISRIKEYCVTQWSKLLEGKVSIQDFTLAKEVKLGSYSERGPPPPGVMVASRKLTEDPRAEAEYGERVPYVITTGEAHRLVDRAMAPEELLNNRELKLDAEYYIRRQLIPPLNRILNLIGVDCEIWYNAMPKRQLASNQHRYKSGRDQKAQGLGRTLDTAFTSIHCLVCGQVNQKRDLELNVCERCRAPANISSTLHALLSRLHLAESRVISAQRICASCSSTPISDEVRCDSIDCSVLYARVKAAWDLDDVAEIPKLVVALQKRHDNAKIQPSKSTMNRKVAKADIEVIEVD
ncbi:hypothetical protein NliqN6_4563 [Naganishia liquefaciens]|uniref:DNA polymerase n=1 Tax=Naganishia liquefaciens TaxID=104408 RepID=A0A8H3TWG3_9TREE|nr:hypothetical protein NliqN6_4563 [Naganishia liquefaciens]